MTGRDRVLSAFRHETPDRTPLFEKLIKLPTANRILGRRHAGVDPEYRMERLADGDWEGLVEDEARDIIEVAELCGFDMIRLPLAPPRSSPRPVRIGEHRWRVGDDIHEFTPGIPWVKVAYVGADASKGERDERGRRKDVKAWEEATVAALEEAWLPPVFDETTFEILRHGRRILQEKGLDLAVFTSVYTMGVANLPEFMLCWFTEKPELLHSYYERHGLRGTALADRLVGLGADIVGLGGDFACDLGPMVSPAHYREFIAPRLRRQSQAIHRLGAYTTNASDGKLWPLLDSFLFEAEVDGYEEIDIAAGMDLKSLKTQYGDRVTFIGNMDIRFTLTRGPEEAIRKATVQCIEAGSGNGGHVLMSSNSIHEDVPPENFFTYLDAYRRYFGL
ncbi:MAG: hypothetical protein HYU36_24095 [Planctomycetes bacterium]|nr:hypothetical protein [Planctomycetota bacterium]